jgi:peptidyl-prolyl cis-trans isomerase SurA
MSESIPALRRIHGLLVAFSVTLLMASFSAACQSTPATPPPATTVSPDTWAVVDGKEITREQVDRTYRRTRDVSQTLSDEETLTAKLNLLNDLIVQEILLAKAAALKVTVPDTEIDTAYNNAKKNITDEAFQQELTKRGLTATDMRDGLRRDLLVQKVIDQEVGGKLAAVTDKEVTDFFNANRAQFNVPEEAYHLAQIVVTPVPEPQTVNGAGDDATNPQEAAAKVKMLMERLKGGTSFQELALGYSEDPESAQRGGDLGFVPISRLKQAPPALRNAVLNKEPGTVSVATAGAAHTLVLVVAHEQAGQRDLSTPAVRERITQMLRGRKEQLLRTAYLTSVRGDAQVVNHLARRVVESKAEMPSLSLGAPAGK